MRFTVVLQNTALRSLEQIYFSISKDSPANARRYAQKLRTACKTLETFPKRCPFAFENGLGGLEIRHLIFGRYRIIFTIADKTVHILSIRAAAQLPLGQEKKRD